MRHMPSGYESVNVLWMWAALLGLNISSWLQALTGHDETVPLVRFRSPSGILRSARHTASVRLTAMA